MYGIAIIYDLQNATSSFMSIFNAIWGFLIEQTFNLFGIPLTIPGITVGIWLGCIGMWMLRKIIYD